MTLLRYWYNGAPVLLGCGAYDGGKDACGAGAAHAPQCADVQRRTCSPPHMLAARGRSRVDRGSIGG
jgi:hypothetical protein